MQQALPASLFQRLCTTELIRESRALTLAAPTPAQLSADVMRHKGNVSEKINRIFFCLQMKQRSTERYRQTFSGVWTAVLRGREELAIQEGAGKKHRTQIRRERWMFVRPVFPSASSPLPPDQSQGCAHCLNLFLTSAGTIGRVLFISLLCSLSTSPVLCTLQVKKYHLHIPGGFMAAWLGST